MIDNRADILQAKRIVIKVGSSTLTHATGKLNFSKIDRLVMQIADLMNQNKQVILVTSGAVAVGVSRLGLSEKPKTIPGKQAAAAVGQGILMHTYEKMFADYGKTVAQVLLTKTEAIDRKRYTNCKNTFLALFEHGVVPIVNENDVVAVDELKIGDNDNMSALVAGIVDADILLILSDVNGLYTANPQTNPDAKLVEVVKDITPEIEASAGGVGSKVGTGGMATKIQAAKVAVNSGAAMVIASGEEKNVICRVMQGENLGTLFLPKDSKLQFRKRWLAFGAKLSGKVIVDDGCAKAIMEKNSSLLPAGISEVQGEFDVGATIAVYTQQGREIARGLTNYNCTDLNLIKGLKSSAIDKALLGKVYEEAIHRDNLIVLV